MNVYVIIGVAVGSYLVGWLSAWVVFGAYGDGKTSE